MLMEHNSTSYNSKLDEELHKLLLDAGNLKQKQLSQQLLSFVNTQNRKQYYSRKRGKKLEILSINEYRFKHLKSKFSKTGATFISWTKQFALLSLNKISG